MMDDLSLQVFSTRSHCIELPLKDVTWLHKLVHKDQDDDQNHRNQECGGLFQQKRNVTKSEKYQNEKCCCSPAPAVVGEQSGAGDTHTRQT